MRQSSVSLFERLHREALAEIQADLKNAMLDHKKPVLKSKHARIHFFFKNMLGISNAIEL